MTKKQVSIYKLKSSFDAVNSTLEDDGYKNIISDNQKKYNQKKHTYIINVYYKSNPIEPKWKKFLDTNYIDIKKSKIKKENFSEYCVVLFFSTDTENLFAITGGYGHHGITGYIDENFGTKVLYNLIDESELVLEKVKERNVMGNILGSQKYFRDNSSILNNNDMWGKIYKEIKAVVGSEKIKNFFDLEFNNVCCTAKNSFKINKNINFEELFNIIKKCNDKLKDMDMGSFNSIKKLSLSGEEKENYKKELLDELWEKYKGDKSEKFYLCHSDFSSYFKADKYIIKNKSYCKEFDSLSCLDDLFNIMNKSNNFSEKEKFKEYIDELRLTSYDEDEYRLTSGSLLSYLTFEYKDNNVLFYNGNFYSLEDNFITELNKKTKKLINKNLHKKNKLKNWKYETGSTSERREDEYNKTHLDQENTLVLDCNTPDGVEMCDILKRDNEKIYLYHVKKSFNASGMRFVCSQIICSAKRLLNDRENKYVKKIFNNIGDSKKINYNTFEKWMGNGKKSKDIVFVLALLDTNKDKNKHFEKGNIEESNSNVAKMHLCDLFSEMNKLGSDLEIYSIKDKESLNG